MYSSFFLPLCMKLIHLLSALVFLTSCGGNSQTETVSKYYDLKSFTENIVQNLSETKPDVSKQWLYNSEKEEKRTNDIDWEKELKLFLDSDINKSSYVTSYDSVVTADKITYTLKASEKVPVKELAIAFDSLKTPKSILSVKESENYFFKTKTRSTLNLENGQLQSYSISAVQKLLWFSADSSFIEGKLQ